MMLTFSIGNYAIVSTSQSVFILGGTVDWSQASKISCFQKKMWFSAGNLKFSRNSHKAIKYGDLIMVVGGWVTADM